MHTASRTCLAATFVVFMLLAAHGFAQTKKPSKTNPGSKSQTTAKDSIDKAKAKFRVQVTLADNGVVEVEDFQMQEAPGGIWIGGAPTRESQSLFYRVRKNGVTLCRPIPFKEIESIEFTTGLEKDALQPEVRRMLVKLNDGGTIEWIHSDRTVVRSSKAGERETLESFMWLNGVVRSGEKAQGQEFLISKFIGTARVDNERGEWSVDPKEIKSIKFQHAK